MVLLLLNLISLRGVGRRVFSVWVFLFGFGFSFCSVHQGNIKAVPCDSGKNGSQAAAPAKTSRISVFSQLLEPGREVVLSLLHPALGMRERRGCFPLVGYHP